METAVRVRGYQFRAYPNQKQILFFEKTFGCCRFVYNHYLQYRRDAWEEWHDTVRYAETSRHLSHTLKPEYPWLREADSVALQQSLRHLDDAYQRFLSKQGGYPKFKSKRGDQSYRTMNVNGSIRMEGSRIRLPKAGAVKIVRSRSFEGRILSASVRRTAGGRYYISLQVEEPIVLKSNQGGQIGLDAGLKNYLTDSEGRIIGSSAVLRRHEKKLKRLQRSLSRKQPANKKSRLK